MTDTSVQQAAFDRFTELYRHAQSDVLRGIERAVCGCDCGATSWTTREEAHECSPSGFVRQIEGIF